MDYSIRFNFVDSNQKEIDLLINYNNIIYPVEIKKSANPGKDAIKNFDVVDNFETEKRKWYSIMYD